MPVWMQAELKRVFDLGYELEFVHCPAHVGVSANEVADEWARRGLAGHACIGGVPTSYILRLVKHEALRSWISDSTSHEVPNSTHMQCIVNHPLVSKGLLPKGVSIPRKWPRSLQRVVISIRAGTSP
eukprot:5302690-Amphidinium_carterae.1